MLQSRQGLSNKPFCGGFLAILSTTACAPVLEHRAGSKPDMLAGMSAGRTLIGTLPARTSLHYVVMVEPHLYPYQTSPERACPLNRYYAGGPSKTRTYDARIMIPPLLKLAIYVIYPYTNQEWEITRRQGVSSWLGPCRGMCKQRGLEPTARFPSILARRRRARLFQHMRPRSGSATSSCPADDARVT